MKKFTSEQLRNVGLFSHGGAGKTTLAEAILFHTGATDRMGKVEEGNTTTDFDPDEIKRKNSIYLAMAPCEWKNNKINIIDTPGFMDFVAEVHSALRVIEGAVMVASAVSGVEVGLEKVWEYSEKYRLPAIMVVNKMDKENANFYKTLDELQKLSSSMIALHLPIGSAENFTGLIDLKIGRAHTFDKGAPKKAEIPKDMEAKVKEHREKLMEAAAESSDELIAKYLDQGEISVAEMKDGIKKGVRARKIVPVLCSAAFKNMGIPLILDSIVEFIPSPAEIGEITGKNLKTGAEEKRKTEAGAHLSALVFKTTADPYVGKLSIMRVYSGTLKSDSPIYNSSKEKEEKIGSLMIIKGKNHE
ncbi:MAG: GTP-binding protein, partial [Firmicutes bacterium]|nr:GTP-binding protein [Bacillota bacterium]